MIVTRVLLILLVECSFLLVIYAQIKTHDHETGQELTVECSNSTECADHFGELAFCKEEMCYCHEGAIFNETIEECVSNMLRAVLGGTCQTDHDCNIAGSVCQNSKCSCPKDFIMSNNKTKCLPVAKELGWGCEESVQCTTLLNKTTECRDLACVCKSGTMLRDGVCVESKGLDAFCGSSTVCSTEHAECSQGVCACKSGFVTASDNARCLEVAQGFKAPCEETIQCTGQFGDNAVCQTGKCMCLPGHHFSEMRCWQDKGLRAQCESHVECYVAEDGNSQRMECASGHCVCKEGFEPDETNTRCAGARGTASLFAAISPLLLLALAKMLAA